MNQFPLGGLVALAVLLPNLLAVFFPPTARISVPAEAESSRLRILTAVERAGQAGCFVLPFFFRIHLAGTQAVAALAVMLALLALYYAGWTRYMIMGRGEEWFYRPLLGIPMPMALAPVVYFLAAAALLSSVWLLLATALLGVGHISVTWINSKIQEKI